jgi:hypothetical protein
VAITQPEEAEAGQRSTTIAMVMAMCVVNPRTTVAETTQARVEVEVLHTTATETNVNTPLLSQ